MSRSFMILDILESDDASARTYPNNAEEMNRKEAHSNSKQQSDDYSLLDIVANIKETVNKFSSNLYQNLPDKTQVLSIFDRHRENNNHSKCRNFSYTINGKLEPQDLLSTKCLQHEFGHTEGQRISPEKDGDVNFEFLRVPLALRPYQVLTFPTHESPADQDKPVCTSFAKKKARKARTAFSDHQLNELERMFEHQKYLSVQDRMQLAEKLHLSDMQVKTWYQNRRTKWKRQAAVGIELLSSIGKKATVHRFLPPASIWCHEASSRAAGIRSDSGLMDCGTASSQENVLSALWRRELLRQDDQLARNGLEKAYNQLPLVEPSKELGSANPAMHWKDKVIEGLSAGQTSIQLPNISLMDLREDDLEVINKHSDLRTLLQNFGAYKPPNIMKLLTSSSALKLPSIFQLHQEQFTSVK